MKSNNTLVSVIILAYNHEAYVAQAIESVLQQKCNFTFELIIGEDNSPDNTREIVIKYAIQYPDTINALLSEHNLGAIENELRCIREAKGKYIAFLEGDDFWTDTLKLQKQVDFLEANPDYCLVHGDVNHLYQDSGKLIEAFNRTNNIKIPSGDILKALFKPSHMIKTMTVCFRKDIFVEHYLNDAEIMSKDWRMIDLSLWFVFAQHSKIHYFDEVFSTYRLLGESMSRTKDSERLFKFHQKIHDIREYFANRYNAGNEIPLMLKTRRYKSDIFDAINMGNKELKRISMLKLRESGGKLSFKEKISLSLSYFKNLFK